jgi:hypothetical protein
MMTVKIIHTFQWITPIVNWPPNVTIAYPMGHPVQDQVAGQLRVPIINGMASCEAMHSYLMVNELGKIILSHLNPTGQSIILSHLNLTGQLMSYPMVIGVASPKYCPISIQLATLITMGYDTNQPVELRWDNILD